MLMAGQNKNYFYKHMEGNVDGTIKLVVDLIWIDKNITGSYYYYFIEPGEDSTQKHYGKVMPLSGNLDEKNTISFTEFKLDSKGAVYTGKFMDGGKIEGIWQNNESTKELPFELLEVYPWEPCPSLLLI